MGSDLLAGGCTSDLCGRSGHACAYDVRHGSATHAIQHLGGGVCTDCAGWQPQPGEDQRALVLRGRGAYSIAGGDHYDRPDCHNCGNDSSEEVVEEEGEGVEEEEEQRLLLRKRSLHASISRHRSAWDHR